MFHMHIHNLRFGQCIPLAFFKCAVLFFINRGEQIAHLQQQCHNSKCVIFQEGLLKVLKCYNFL